MWNSSENANDKMFYVVQLDSDIFKEKIVVPSIWLDKYNTLCHLPPVTDVTEVETLAKVQSTPKHGWQLHNVSFKQSFDTYSQAKENITKDKPVMIKLEEEEEKQHYKEIRGKRKRKFPQFIKQYSIESDSDESCSSLQDDSSIEDNVVSDPLVVKIKAMKDFNAQESDQQPRLNTAHNKSSSTAHSGLHHGSQLQVAKSSSSSMRRMNFAVVKFVTEDDFVAIISSNWITDDRKRCRYPNSPNVERLLKNRIRPTPNWKMYPIKIIKEYDSLSKAMQKAKKLTQTSNVSSDSSEELSNQPRKRQKPARYVTDSNTAKKSKRARNCSESSGSENESLIYNNKRYKIPQMPKNDEFIGSTSRQIRNNKRIFQVLERINKKVSELNYKVDCLTSKVEKITSSSTHLPAAFHYLPEDVSLPVTSLEELDELNNRLKSDKEFFTTVVRFLYSSGTGKSKHSFMLSLTKKVLSKEIAMQFSRYGRKGKKPFINYMETLNVILAAASLKFKEAERQDLGEMFGKSLAGASDWNVGRFDRQIIQQ